MNDPLKYPNDELAALVLGEPDPLQALSPHALEEQLIDFAVAIIGVVESLPTSKAGNHIAGQLIRSGTSPAPNYAEARGAESHNDFVHKIKISLKELRESLVWLKILTRKKMGENAAISASVSECNELIAIFVSSAKTADRHRART